MEKVARFRPILVEIIEQEAQHRPGSSNVEVCQIYDDQHQHYQLLYIGWQGDTRVFAPVIHLRIHNGKIWVEHDGTEDGVTEKLLAAGIPRDEIVLAFYSPQKRSYTEFAVA
jgi:hypothetical protein